MNILLSIGIAWIACQLIKIILSKKISAFWNVGGMPSSHSSLVGALATAVALQEGFASTPAVISYVILTIVVRDAVHLRHTLKEVLVGLGIGIIAVSLLFYI